MTHLSRLLAAAALVSGCATDDTTPDFDKDQAAADADRRPEDGKQDGFDVCVIAGWYGDGVCDRFCQEFDSDCPLLGDEPVGAATQYPIVLHHGMAGGRS